MVNATLVTLKLLDESDQENLPDPLCYYSSLRGYRLTQDPGLKLSVFVYSLKPRQVACLTWTEQSSIISQSILYTGTSL